MTDTDLALPALADLSAGVARPATADGTLQRVVLPGLDAPLEMLGVYVRATDGSADAVEPLDRTSLRIAAGRRASFDTFFNAFPAGYYRRWTSLSRVRLRMTVEGCGRVDVYQSSGRGRVVHHSSTPFEGRQDLDLELPLAGHFADGGYYWFTVTARQVTTVSRAGWCTDEPPARRGATVGICTFNRPDECVATLRTLIADPEAVAGLDGVVVVDQGDRRVEDAAGFPEVAAAWGARLRVVPQGNLGGSGGFSRAMYEVLQAPAAGDVILMDDDIVPEPESVLRAMAFAAASAGRVLVHGHMLDLWSRTRLHNTGDLVDTRDFSTRAVARHLEDIDLIGMPLAHAPGLHRRFDTMFGGWWMCLVPRQALAELGLSLPVFIKWDDIEYGLRAAEHGYPTVTVPGIGVWHMPFHAKDVNSDWTAYFEGRNRILVALLYGDDASVRGTVLSNFKGVVKALVSMNYSAAELHHLAVQDLFRGPDFVFDDLPHVAGRVRGARKGFPDAEILTDMPAGFDSTLDVITVEQLSEPPRTWLRGRLNLVLGVGHALASATASGRARRADLTNREPKWAVLARLDEAMVSAADGSALSRRLRNNGQMRGMLARAAADHARIVRESARLRAVYREGLPRMTDPERWAGHFR